MSHIERNYNILKEKMINQMETALTFGKKLIDSELDAGLLNFVVKPVVKAFYNYWCDKDARTGTKKQIKLVLDLGKRLVINGSQDTFEKLIEDNFQEYLQGDQTYLRCNKNHRDFTKLREITKECFISQVEGAVKFLEVQDAAEDYDDLTRSAFKTKEEAYDILSKQLDYHDKGIKIVERDPEILDVPTGKKIIINILRKGFEQTKKELVERLNTVYK
ncbi:MAG: hypothetical protein BAJALOKI1v1_2000003 [Promethearchaeota archaeon]|nr:MAG: hypothetical protein BAJALOKI1v1_2000003 [Candidatus Lokiarchaeota archaeon]